VHQPQSCRERSLGGKIPDTRNFVKGALLLIARIKVRKVPESHTPADIITCNEGAILADWMKTMVGSIHRADLMSAVELQEQCQALLAETHQRREVDGSSLDCRRRTMVSFRAKNISS
jgi:hypothetical protein